MRHVLVMGICGTGKSTLAAHLAERMACPLVEADEYHSPEAVARMSRGAALTDAHRWSWLDRVADAAASAGDRSVIACSALKDAYRQRLAERLGPLDVIFLHGDRDLIATRMAGREGHYMPTSLIDSQLADLEPPEGDDVLALDISDPFGPLADAAHDFANRSRQQA
ncbi:Thermoresistant gluconokinase [Roseivivax jejudonensis]|uniref:Gluconokinase n=1 Tax=Roseivivax jejudonensis TaxID=1529041 RepID=A0A1X6ZBN0_9RHOB|nr:gluconokinase, GntK/IdnK-type [Roseivivax jejudonensis]SLN46276.1 Thermoresistant gluconokinase [Roseivivax jejudonensis]